MKAEPTAWPEKSLRDVLLPLKDGKLLHQGWSPRCDPVASNDPEEWAVLKTTAIQDGWFDERFNKRLPTSLSPDHGIEVCAGDILLTCAGPRVRCGVACMVHETRPRLMLSGKMYRFRANGTDLTSEFLLAYLRSPEGKAAIDTIKTGGSESGLNLTHGRFLDLRVPIPEVSEQERIVERLNALFLHSNGARTELARIPKLVERYRQAILTSAFRGDLTSEWRAERSRALSDWKLSAIGQIAAVGTGATPKRGTARFYSNGTIPWVTSGAVNDDQIDDTTELITEVALKETNCKVFPPGTLLVAMYGEGHTRGKVSVLNIHAATNQALAAISIRDPKAVNSRFVFWFLKSNYLELRKMAAGGVQPNLNLSMIKDTSLELPRFDEQVEIVRRIEQLMQRVETLNRESSVPLRLLERLEQATSIKAFEGAL